MDRTLDAPAARLPVSALGLAWRQGWRDFRAGELRLLMVAVMLAVAALTAVGFFASRLEAALARDARALLGGDAVVASDQPAPPAFADKARALGLRVVSSATFPSMARAPDDKGGESRLVALKAVTEGYPLRGTMRVKAGPAAAEEKLSTGPPRGGVWADAALLEALQLQVGDGLMLGEQRLTIHRVIVLEPDRGAGFMSFAPRVMLHAGDLASTGLIQPASRVTYRLAVAAPEGRPTDERQVREFVRWAEAHIAEAKLRGLRTESLESGRPEMRQTLDRAQRFLNLVALLAALLSAVAVAIAARDFAQRHLDDCAMLRVLGAPQRAIAGAYALEFGAIGLLASLLGVALGFAVHFIFVRLLANLLEAALPAPTLAPAAFGIGVGLTLLVAFGLPPVLQLARVPPLRVIRRDVGGVKAASVGVLLAGSAGFAALLVAASSDLMLGLIAVGGFAAAIAVFAVLAWGAVMLLKRAVPETRAPRWLVLATRQLAARPAFAVLQVSALAVGLLALVLLVLLRTDLIAAWRQATPKDAPNRFVINLQPEQGEPFQAMLKAAGIARYDWYPMIRARLVAVNGQEVGPAQYTEDRARRLVEREFNVSHAAALPGHNSVSAGAWTADEAEGLSVEEGLAQTLKIKLGDRLRFDIGGIQKEGRITSLRKVDWGSMRVNFFVIFPQSRLDDVPISYISAFRAPQTPGFDSALSRQFPNITNVDVSVSLAQVQQVLDQVIRAVEFLFGFTLAAGLVVLFAAVASTRESRAREYAVMRAVGAGSALLRQMQRAELLGVGALAGLLASIAAITVGGVMARQVFEFTWAPSPWVPLAGTAVGALLALTAGWWGLREVLRRPVMETLRRAAE
ncbi:FtsX-like permease family protein [Aquincola sp. S2]|uniref:FtsX-like permease family protein n=1 Tax=Pseudaquabacterium terrae TaxID=2732868 RepID=A0ABX2ENE5_9BURK|nr:FtsX-like permease family protein [Aquabacterium terrae]NRF70093.1 FtsX-like permease family protein [Aquabacterium terrae]